MGWGSAWPQICPPGSLLLRPRPRPRREHQGRSADRLVGRPARGGAGAEDRQAHLAGGRYRYPRGVERRLGRHGRRRVARRGAGRGTPADTRPDAHQPRQFSAAGTRGRLVAGEAQAALDKRRNGVLAARTGADDPRPALAFGGRSGWRRGLRTDRAQRHLGLGERVGVFRQSLG